MQIKIEPAHYPPVHVQLKEQIKFLILKGDLAPGSELPASRELADLLHINRNTVLRGYQELVREGLIECRRGGRCAVVERPAEVAQPVSPHLLEIIDDAIASARQLGVSPDDFAALAYVRARQHQDTQAKHRLAFVECETLVTATLARVIQEELQLEVTPIDLQDLQEPTADVERKLREVDMVVTTIFHLREVKRLLAGTRKSVVALMVKPHLGKLIEIAQIPQGTPTALVCVSASCAADMKRSLEHAGVKGLDVSAYGADDQPLAGALPRYPVVIASNLVADRIRPLAQPDQQLIVVDFTSLDEGAIDLLRLMVTEGLEEE